MKRFLCALLGHRVGLRWYWHSPKGPSFSGGRRGVQVRAECERCGRPLSKLEAKPR